MPKPRIDLISPHGDEPDERFRELVAWGCPKCGGKLGRIPRRPVDLLISAFTTIRRVRCQNVACQYERNL